MAETIKANNNGLNRCPHCGATGAKQIPKTDKLRCQFCRSEFEAVKNNAAGVSGDMKKRNVAAGAADIIPDDKRHLIMLLDIFQRFLRRVSRAAVVGRCHVALVSDQLVNDLRDVIVRFMISEHHDEGRLGDIFLKVIGQVFECHVGILDQSQIAFCRHH